MPPMETFNVWVTLTMQPSNRTAPITTMATANDRDVDVLSAPVTRMVRPALHSTEGRTQVPHVAQPHPRLTLA